jgi:hypothetical protein
MGSERRGTPRVFTTLPISFEWDTEEGHIRRARGSTRDVSRGGIYSYVEHPLTPALDVRFEVVFSGELTAADPLKLWCSGPILRSEILGRRFGVAASIQHYKVLETLEPVSESDRRQNLRIIPPEAIVAEYPGIRSVIRDLSPTGAFVEEDRPFPVGRVIDMRLRGEGLEGEIEVKAIVRRVEAQIGMAVEFIALSKGTRAYLLKFVDKHLTPHVSPITATTSSA